MLALTRPRTPTQQSHESRKGLVAGSLTVKIEHRHKKISKISESPPTAP